MAIQKDKRAKEIIQNKTIPIEKLNNFLENNSSIIPDELIPFTTLLDYPNTLLDLYKITHYTIKNSTSIVNKVLIFTEKCFNIEEVFNKKYHTLEILKRWNINIVNSEILEYLRDKQLLKNEALRLITKYRLVPIEKNNYIHLDTLEHFDNISINLINENDKREKSILEKARVPFIYNAKRCMNILCMRCLCFAIILMIKSPLVI